MHAYTADVILSGCHLAEKIHHHDQVHGDTENNAKNQHCLCWRSRTTARQRHMVLPGTGKVWKRNHDHLFCQGHFSFDWSHHLHWCRTCWRPPWGQQFHLPTDLCLPLLPRFTNNYPVFEIPCNNGTVISVANDDGFFWCLLWYSVHTQLTTFCFKLGSASMWTSLRLREDPLHDSGTRHTLMFTYVSNSGVVSGTRYRTVSSKHPIIPKKQVPHQASWTAWMWSDMHR